MLSKKTVGIAAACALALGAWSGAALATPVNVNGVTWDTSSMLNLQVQGINLRETSVANKGDLLTGYGQVGQINGDTGFCVGTGSGACVLTFTFQYTVSDIGISAAGNPQVVFTGGTVNFFVNNDTASGTFSQTNPGSATLGTPWLTLTGVTTPATGFSSVGQLYSNVTGTLTAPEGGSNGFGLMNVSGGDAAPYLNMYTNLGKNGQAGGLANFSFNSSFLDDGIKVCGSMTSDGASYCFPISGTATLAGVLPKNVPEPGDLGLLGLGLGMIGLLFWRRRKEADERA